jgi:hypothetical protein
LRRRCSTLGGPAQLANRRLQQRRAAKLHSQLPNFGGDDLVPWCGRIGQECGCGSQSCTEERVAVKGRGCGYCSVPRDAILGTIARIIRDRVVQKSTGALKKAIAKEIDRRTVQAQRVVEVDGVCVSVRFVGRTGRRARIAILVPRRAAFHSVDRRWEAMGAG